MGCTSGALGQKRVNVIIGNTGGGLEFTRYFIVKFVVFLSISCRISYPLCIIILFFLGMGCVQLTSLA